MMKNVVDEERIALQLNSVAFSYRQRSGFFRHNEFWALKNISFTVSHGETLGVIGRNGVGKSTLLKLLAGIYLPEKGEIIRNTGKISLLSLQAGFVPYLTGRENAILSGMLLGLSYKEVQDALPEIIEFSELRDFIEQPVKTYSMGMKARLGFSVALKVNPDVVLLDEILGVGDEEFKKKSQTAMIERMKSNKTIVLASHNIQLLKRVCNRAVWIEAGVTKAEGKTDEVIREYHSFVNGN